MLHISRSFLSRFMVRIKRPIVYACKFIMVWWIFFVRWIPTRTCDPHVLTCLFISFIIRVLSLALNADLLERLCSCMRIDSMLISFIISILLFVAIVITSLVLGIQILLQPRLALRLSCLSVLAKVCTSRRLTSSYSHSSFWFWCTSTEYRHHTWHLATSLRWPIFCFWKPLCQGENVFAQSNSFK